MSAIRQTKAERDAMLDECARVGRETMNRKGFTIADAVAIFAAMTDTQRARTMRHYKRDGSRRSR